MGRLIALILIAIIFSFIYTVFLSVPIDIFNISDLFYKIGQFLGLFGFLCISLLIISGDSARFFDKYFGIDRIIKTQRKFAIFTYYVVFSHPIFIILSMNSYLKFLIPQFTILSLAAGTFALYIFTGIMISSLNYKKISYNVWQYIHIATYILFALVWYHSFNIGSSISEPQIEIIYYILPILVFIGIIYRTNYKLKQRNNKFFLKEIIKETEDTFTLVIQSKYPVSFKPGQFFFLRIEGKKLYARHPFSTSSSPSEKTLSFTMKLAGRFTKVALNLKPGQEIKMEGPFGNFILRENKGPVFIAGGVGITPFMSIIKDNQEAKEHSNILLLYGSRTEKDIIFKESLDSIKEPWLNKVYILSQEKKSGYEYGRMDKEFIIKHIKDLNNKTFYICGPQEMNKLIFQALADLGVKKEDIITEDFFW